MFISEALAQTAPAADPMGLQSILASPIPMLFVMLAIFYLLVLRPQSKRAKAHQAMVKALKRGDKVVTNGGILGVVSKATDGEAELEVEIAQGVKVRVLRSAVSDIASRVPEAKATADKSGDKSTTKTGAKEGANDA
jgi:preprotein translocase subunit YajC